MQIQERSAQARRAIDRKFRQTDLTQLRARPHAGWIRAIRNALGMSQNDLGARLGTTAAAVAKLERAEPHGGITLAKLDEVARGLDCTLVYALVPNTTLQSAVERQARHIAKRQLGYVATTMALENQAVGGEWQAEQLDQLTKEWVRRRDLWKQASALIAGANYDSTV